MPQIKTNDIETYYQEYGQGKPLILIHGAWTDGYAWKSQIEYFSPKFRVIAYDLRGHGRSGDGDPDRKYSIDLFAEDLKALMDGLGIEKAAVCGLSVGAYAAQTFAARWPERVSALVLAGSRVSFTMTRKEKIFRRIFFPWPVTKTLVNLLGSEGFSRFLVWSNVRINGKEAIAVKEEVRDYLHRCKCAFSKKRELILLESLYNFKPAELEKITAPTLLVNGEYEPRGAEKHVRTLLSSIPKASLAVVPESGHSCHLDNPEEFNQIVGAFLDGRQFARPE